MNEIGGMLAHVVPLALGAAVSPALLGASLEVLIAFGTRGARMLVGYLLGAALVVAGVLALSTVLPKRPATTGGSTDADIIDVALATILIILAVVLVARRAPEKKSGTMTRLLQARWVVVGVVGLGVFMMVTNVSTIVLVLAGAHEASSSSDVAARWIGYVVLAIGALLPILIPLVWVLVRPAAATRELGRVNAVITRHGRVIGIVVCVVTALYLVARAFGVI